MNSNLYLLGCVSESLRVCVRVFKRDSEPKTQTNKTAFHMNCGLISARIVESLLFDKTERKKKEKTKQFLTAGGSFATIS